MIRYSLKCDQSHGFDAWFADAESYDSLLAAGQVTCPSCGSHMIEKALMAPAVRPARRSSGRAGPSADHPAGGASAPAHAAPSRPGPTGGPLSGPATAMEAAMIELRRQVESNSEYVGVDFAREARKMHEGESPERAIYGEARPDEARQLIEDGVPVMPLPFLPARKVN